MDRALSATSRQSREKMIDEAASVGKGIVERHRRYSQDVRFPPVTHSPLLDQSIADGAAGSQHSDRDLRSAVFGLGWRKYREVAGLFVSEQIFQVAGQ